MTDEMTKEELIEFRNEVIGIMSVYAYNDKDRIFHILDLIQKYPETARLYHADMGFFS